MRLYSMLNVNIIISSIIIMDDKEDFLKHFYSASPHASYGRENPCDDWCGVLLCSPHLIDEKKNSPSKSHVVSSSWLVG